MIVSTREMLLRAQKEKFAVPAFNFHNLETIQTIVEGAAEMKSPVILAGTPGTFEYGGRDYLQAIVEVASKKYSIPIAIHLDHHETFESIKKSVDLGTKSVMIDASKYSLEENINITKEVVEYAHSKNITVEAEVGHIGGVEDGIASGVLVASLDDCIKFVKETKVDMLAPAIGSVHGVYKGEPKLDFELLTSLKNNINIPLVLHGGSGIPEDKIIKAIKLGISKININTELQQAWHEGVLKFVENKKEVYDPRKIISSGEENLKNIVEYKLSLME